MADPWAFGWTQLLTIAGLCLTAGGLLVGYRTLDRWRTERIEERKIDIAFECLSVAYEAKYIFSTIRNPFASADEWEDMPQIPGETADQRRQRAPFYATLKRINNNREFFEKVFRLQPRCMALFGHSVEEIFSLLYRARSDIEIACVALSDPEGLESEDIKKFRAAVWNFRQREDDEVGQKLEKFRLGIEQLCGPVVGIKFRK